MARKRPTGKVNQHGVDLGMKAYETKGLTDEDVDKLIEIQQDNTDAVEDAITEGIMVGLEKIGLLAEGYAKAKCPRESGRLSNSITHVLKGGASPAVYIGTNVEYGKYVEEGTSKQKAQPFLEPAATGHTSEYKAIMLDAIRDALGQ